MKAVARAGSGRTVTQGIRFTRGERAALRKAAAEHRMTLSDYVRRKCFGGIDELLPFEVPPFELSPGASPNAEALTRKLANTLNAKPVKKAKKKNAPR